MKLVINLSGDFLCPFQVFIDIAEQLSDSFALKQRAFLQICELTTVSDWINFESLGKSVALQAQKMNEALNTLLVQHAITQLELHIHLLDSPLTIDNVYALLFLADSLDKLDLFFYIHPSNLSALQAMTQSLQAKATINYLENEPFTQEVTQLEKKRYALLQTRGFPFHPTWLATMDVTQPEAGILIGYAWTCLKLGAYELGCRVLEKILDQSSSVAPQRELFFLHLQLIRFLSHQYAKVTQQVFPEQFQFLAEADITHLYFIKAYSATLSRQLDIAETYFAKCHVHADLPMTDETSLYRLNLYALFLVLKQDIATAYALEMKIQNFIEKNAIDIVGLKYVNFINIARLHKKLQQFDTALAYYEKAYNEINEGGYTPSDYIYYNLNLGSLYEAAQQPKKAISFWMKAALYWLTSKNPYALAWRPRLILCREKMLDILAPLSRDKVHQFFYEKLSELVIQTEMDLTDAVPEMFHFVLEEGEVCQKESCYVTDSIILYGSQNRILSAKQSFTDSELKLRQLLSTLLKKVLNITDNQRTLIIDVKHENNYPQSSGACAALAMLLDCKECYYKGERVFYDMHHFDQTLTVIQVALSKVISAISSTAEGLQLTYKRSFLNKKLCAAEEINVVNELLDTKVMMLNHLTDYPKKTLLELIDKKVLAIRAYGV